MLFLFTIWQIPEKQSPVQSKNASQYLDMLNRQSLGHASTISNRLVPEFNNCYNWLALYGYGG